MVLGATHPQTLGLVLAQKGRILYHVSVFLTLAYVRKLADHRQSRVNVKIKEKALEADATVVTDRARWSLAETFSAARTQRNPTMQFGSVTMAQKAVGHSCWRGTDFFSSMGITSGQIGNENGG